MWGGFDTSRATVFTAPAPTAPAEAALWAKFGFAAEGGRLVRRRKPDLSAVQLAQQFVAGHCPAPGLCIDATCGNGGDTAFLWQLVQKSGGRVLAMDIQQAAILSTRRRLEKLGQTPPAASWCRTATKTCCITSSPAAPMPSCSTLAGCPEPTTRYTRRRVQPDRTAGSPGRFAPWRHPECGAVQRQGGRLG